MDNIILENFELDPLLIDDPYVLFKDESEYLNGLITEATDNLPLVGIFSSLVGFIQKSLSWISQRIKDVTNFLFSGMKYSRKSANQIADELDIKPTKRKGGYVEEGIPVNDASKNKDVLNVKDAFNDIYVQFGNEEVVFTFFDTVTKSPTSDKYDVKGQSAVIGSWGQGLQCTFKCILNQDIMRLYNESAELILDLINNGKHMKPDEISVACDDINYRMDEANHKLLVDNDAPLKYIAIKEPELREFQVQINTLLNNIGKINLRANRFNRMMISNSKKKELFDKINSWGMVVQNIQMGINHLSGILKDVYVVDARYFESCTDINKLSQFVGKCINAGIYSKYIGYNVYKISSKSIKGDGSEDDPIWGQSRLVLFPPNKNLIYKVALSQMGVNSNISEIKITDKFHKYNADKIITRIIAASENNTIVSMEKADPGTIGHLSIHEYAYVRRSLVSVAKRIPSMKGIKITDLHPGNCGKKNGQPVCTDYGFTTLTT